MRQLSSQTVALPMLDETACTEPQAKLLDETAIIQQAQYNPATFGTIYDHYFDNVYNFVRYRVQDAALADELTAQIFEKALTRIDSYKPHKSPFPAWLFAIARNTLKDYWRQQQRRRWLSLDAIRHRASAKPTPDEVAIREEDKGGLLTAVSQLSPREQEIIALKFGAGLNNRTIAKITHLSASNVSVILFRAIKKLRSLLGSQK